MRKELETTALKLLESSLNPLPHELNELDWKAELSEKSEKLAQHISAFANYPAGGFFVFGVNDNGDPVGVKNLNYGGIISRIGNIAREGVEPSVVIDQAILSYQGKELLFVYIPESSEKPVHLRSGTLYDSYVRSACQTRKMTRQEVARAIAASSGESFESDAASASLSDDEIIRLLDIQSFFDLLGRARNGSNSPHIIAPTEQWLARELQHRLGYAKWHNFLNVVSKARTACEVSDHTFADHFPDAASMVDLGSDSSREVDFRNAARASAMCCA